MSKGFSLTRNYFGVPPYRTAPYGLLGIIIPSLGYVVCFLLHKYLKWIETQRCSFKVCGWTWTVVVVMVIFVLHLCAIVIMIVTRLVCCYQYAVSMMFPLSIFHVHNHVQRIVDWYMFMWKNPDSLADVSMLSMCVDGWVDPVPSSHCSRMMPFVKLLNSSWVRCFLSPAVYGHPIWMKYGDIWST